MWVTSRAIGDSRWRLTAFPEIEKSRQMMLDEPWVLDGLSDTPGGCRLRLALRVTRGRAIYGEMLDTSRQDDRAAAIEVD